MSMEKNCKCFLIRCFYFSLEAEQSLKSLLRTSTCIHLIWQCDFSHNATYFVPFLTFEIAHHIVLVMLVLRFFLTPLCFMDASIQSCSGAVLWFLVTWLRGSFFWLWIEPISLHSSRHSDLENDLTAFVIPTSSTHLLISLYPPPW